MNAGRQTRSTPQARLDELDHAIYLGEVSLSLADRFLDALAETYAFLGTTPFAGRVWPLRSDTRQWRVRGFPNHLILYRVHDEVIEILRVVHASQDLDVAELIDGS